MDPEEEKIKEQEDKEREKRKDNPFQRVRNAEKNLGRAKKVVKTAKTGARVGRQVATQGGKVAVQAGRAAVQAGRAAAQAGVQAAQAAAQATVAAIQATIAAIQATVAAIQAGIAAVQALIATAEVWVPVAAIVIGVVLAIMLISAIFMFFFVGTPPPVGGGGGGSLDCVADLKGTCQAATPCTAPNVPDTTGATCSDPTTPVCCVPLHACTGTCVTGKTCTNPTDTIDPTASCAGGTTQICCVTPGAQPPIHFYCQYDRRYRPPATNNPTDQSCDLQTYGCATTSIAMVAASFGLNYNPLTVAEANGFMGCFSGSEIKPYRAALTNTFPPDQFSIITVSISGGVLDIAQVKTLTGEGYIIIGSGCLTFKSTREPYGGHALVISSVNADGTLKVYDPANCTSNASSGVRKLNPNVGGGDVMSGGLSCGTDRGWWYAFAIKKL